MVAVSRWTPHTPSHGIMCVNTTEIASDVTKMGLSTSGAHVKNSCLCYSGFFRVYAMNICTVGIQSATHNFWRASSPSRPYRMSMANSPLLFICLGYVCVCGVWPMVVGGVPLLISRTQRYEGDIQTYKGRKYRCICIYLFRCNMYSFS